MSHALRRIAFVPARAGSQRVKSKNTRVFQGHPLMAYAIHAARSSGVFDRVIVSTDSEETRQIALRYGAEAPFLRPSEFATSVATDIQWLTHAFDELKDALDVFSIVRPTSPFRTGATIRRAMDEFLTASKANPGIDSLRAVELCHEHPGKMWVVEEQSNSQVLRPLLDQSHMEVPWHARQYQDCPKVYVQNSSLEIAWARVIRGTRSREGKCIMPFFTDRFEGFSIDYEEQWILAEHLVSSGKVQLPAIG